MVKKAKQKAASRIDQLIKAGRCNERAMVRGGYDAAQRQQNNNLPTLTWRITRTEYTILERKREAKEFLK